MRSKTKQSLKIDTGVYYLSKLSYLCLMPGITVNFPTEQFWNLEKQSMFVDLYTLLLFI